MAPLLSSFEDMGFRVARGASVPSCVQVPAHDAGGIRDTCAFFAGASLPGTDYADKMGGFRK